MFSSSSHSPSGRLPSSTPKWIIALSCLLALWLNTLPIPLGIHAFAPDFLLFMLVFWAIFEPTRVGIFTAWTMGLFMDVIHGTLLSQHSLCYAIAVFLGILSKRRLFRFSSFYQSIHVLPIIFLGHATVEWISYLRNNHIAFPFYLLWGNLWIIPLWMLAYHWLFHKHRHALHAVN